MPAAIKKKLVLITAVYWVLLLYMVTALIWWFISLTSQNKMMTDFKISKLEFTIDRTAAPEKYMEERDQINREYSRNTVKYISEGTLFFLVIVFVAVYIYRAVRREFYVQQQQQHFLMAVTHELKTPISVARLNLETIQKYTLEPGKREKLIKMTLQETERLDFLTNNILVSSRLEGGDYASSKEEMNLSDLLKDCLQEFRNRYPGRKFLEQIAPNMDIKGDALLLKIMISNLLENGVKYTPMESTITARLNKTATGIRMEILDEGPGIPDKEKKKIFDKFYRISNDTTRKTRGSGLGLFLCRKIARDHHAGIIVSDNIPAGCNFMVTFYQ